MATANPFDLLGDDDNDDPSQLIAAQQLKVAAKKPAAVPPPAAAAAKLPSKPVPRAQAVREARDGGVLARGGAGHGGPGRGRGGRGGGTGPNRGFGNANVSGISGGYGGSGGGGDGEDVDAVKPFETDRNFDRERVGERERGGYGRLRPPFRGGRRGGYGNGEAGDDSERQQRRPYERRSGTGRGYEMKREGAGRGNWGTASDDMIARETEENVNADEKVASPEKQPEQEGESSLEANKENKEGGANEAEEKEQEEKEMTLDEYEKIREEKRKALLAMKTEERKVDLDKEFESMQQLSLKKGNDDVFIKLGTHKDAVRRKENADREERAKKSVSISQFLKPAEGERYYNPGGRGRGRGRGDRGPFRGGFGGGAAGTPAAPSIEDPSQFPTLGK